MNLSENELSLFKLLEFGYFFLKCILVTKHICGTYSCSFMKKILVRPYIPIMQVNDIYKKLAIYGARNIR